MPTYSLQTPSQYPVIALVNSDGTVRDPFESPVFFRLAADMVKGGGAGAGDTTLANVTGMSFAIAASKVWQFEMALFYDGATTGDAKFAVTIPAGATMLGVQQGIANSATGAIASTDPRAFAGGGTSQAGGAGVGTKLGCTLRGIIVNGATAGTAQLQFAQGTADGTNASTLFANSFGRAWLAS